MRRPAPIKSWLSFAGEYCLMLLDGPAERDQATALRVPSTVCLLPLPPDSPELNPVEHIRDYFREQDFGIRVFPTLGR